VAKHPNWRIAAAKVTMKQNIPFVAHLFSFKGNDEVLLLLADRPAISWLMSQLAEFACTRNDSRRPAFVIGDGNPVQSDGRCIISVELDHQANGGKLVQQTQNTFRWSLSPSSADHYRQLLSGMLKNEVPCHQYLDPDNLPAPVLIVSLGEYQVDVFRGPTT